MKTFTKQKATEVLRQLMRNLPVLLPEPWDPISNPLDTYRMGMSLRLDINFTGAWVYVSRDEDFEEVCEPTGQYEDVDAAVCRAIVRAALALAGHPNVLEVMND